MQSAFLHGSALIFASSICGRGFAVSLIQSADFIFSNHSLLNRTSVVRGERILYTAPCRFCVFINLPRSAEAAWLSSVGRRHSGEVANQENDSVARS